MRSRPILVLVAALAAGLVLPSATAASRPPDRGADPTEIRTVPWARSSTVPGHQAVRELRTPAMFAMAAVTWTGEAPDELEIKSREDGRGWGPWIPLAASAHGDAAGPSRGTRLAWLDDSTALRVRAKQQGRPMDPAALSVVLVDPSGAPVTTTTSGSGTLAAKPDVISREEWGADEQVRTECWAEVDEGEHYGDTTKAATLHHTDHANDYTRAEAVQIVRGIFTYHAVNRNWCDIGYNALVDRFGRIFEGRYGGLDKPVWGAHAGGFNKMSTGVAMIGRFGEVAPGEAQLEAVSRFMAWKLAGNYRDPHDEVTLTSTGGSPSSKYPEGAEVTLPSRIHGHRDVRYTVCPGDTGYEALPRIRDRVAELMGDWRSSPIHRRWQETGAGSGPLKGVYALERAAADGGLRTTFDSGDQAVYWSQEHGAHIVAGPILDKWSQYDKERGPLGYPRTDERVAPDGVGRYNHFSGANGSIYWTPATGAHEIRGAIKGKWAELGWEGSYLGYPTSDEYSVPGGRRSDFQGGYITWSAATGAVAHR